MPAVGLEEAAESVPAAAGAVEAGLDYLFGVERSHLAGLEFGHPCHWSQFDVQSVLQP